MHRCEWHANGERCPDEAAYWVDARWLCNRHFEQLMREHEQRKSERMNMKRALAVIAALFLMVFPSYAQTPAPSTASMSFNVGAGAFGLGGTNATPATDIALTLNPGIAKAPNFSFRSDNLLAPGANLQYFGGGGSYKLPKLSKAGLLASVHFELNATAGLDRISPPNGSAAEHFAMMAGASMHYTTSAGVDMDLFQVGYIRTPGAPWGGSAPYFGGSISYLFGKQ